MCFHPLEVFLCHVWWKVAGDLVMIRFQNTIWPSFMTLIIGRSTLWFLSFSHEITGEWALTGFRFFTFLARAISSNLGSAQQGDTTIKRVRTIREPNRVTGCFIVLDRQADFECTGKVCHLGSDVNDIEGQEVIFLRQEDLNRSTAGVVVCEGHRI